MDGTDYFYETLGDIYDDKNVIQFLKDFHSSREHSFFIGLPEEELTEEELNKPLTLYDVMCQCLAEIGIILEENFVYSYIDGS